MKKIIKITLILGILFSLFSCKNENKNNLKEKELLEKEVELLKKEKELMKREEKNTKNISKKKKVVTNEVIDTSKNTTKKNNIEPKYLISKNGVGKFIIGEKAPTSLPAGFNIEKKTAIDYDDPNTYGEKYVFYMLTENGNELLTYRMGYNNVISKISIISEKFKTHKNIGLETKIADFQKVYPDYEVWEAYEGIGFGISTKKVNASFLLDKSDFLGKTEQVGDMIKLTNVRFKKNSRIKEIVF